MIGDLGTPELLVILAIVVLLFGVGKLGRLGKDLGSAVREFRSAVHDEDAQPPPTILPAPDSTATTGQTQLPPSTAATAQNNGASKEPAARIF
jgi:TatA/E family protein of Tat protein translocase